MDWQSGGSEPFEFTRSENGVFAAVWRVDGAMPHWFAVIIAGLRSKHDTREAAKQWCEEQLK